MRLTIRSIVSVVAVSAVVVTAFAQQTNPRFYWLGRLSGGSESRALGVSENGTVVGWSLDGQGLRRAVIWYRNQQGVPGAPSALPMPQGGFQSIAYDASRGFRIDNARYSPVAVGAVQFSDGLWSAGFWAIGCWSTPYGEQCNDEIRWFSIPGLYSGYDHFARAVTHNNEYGGTPRIVGHTGDESFGGGLPFAWSGTTSQLSGSYGEAYAFGVSPEGSVIVGRVDRSPAYWLSPTQGPFPLPQNGPKAEARDASSDGNIIVGWQDTGVGTLPVQPCVWRKVNNQYFQQVLTLTGFQGKLNSVSADGKTAVGFRYRGSSSDPIRFRDAGNGQWNVDYLQQTYASLIGSGSLLFEATAISPNGRYIVGYGFNGATQRVEGFLLIVDCRIDGDVNQDGVVDDQDLLRVLFTFGSTGTRPEDLNGDGRVDDADLLVVLFNFGRRC